jgi:hypothetical protein
MKEFWILSVCIAALVGGLVELNFAIEPHPLAKEWGAPWYVMVLVYMCGGMLIARTVQWGHRVQNRKRMD